MTRFVLIRHASVNSGARLYGWFDVPLSTRGVRELDAIRQTAPALTPDALYASPLRRAWTVALRLGDLWQREPRPCVALREIHCGTLEGLHLHDLQRYYPTVWARNKAQIDENFTWPGGESYRCFRTRVLSGLTNLAHAHPDHRVALVTHSGVISQVLGALHGRSAAEWEADRPEPLTATEVLWGSNGPQELVTYNRRDWC